jgi:hypothetical protein
MPDLSAFFITHKWPPRHPERLQLYSLATPNGVKVSIMLEELGLPYEAHLVRLEDDEQSSAEFRSLNPYGKIPAILDPDGPDGQPQGLFESGAILITRPSANAGTQATRRPFAPTACFHSSRSDGWAGRLPDHPVSWSSHRSRPGTARCDR